MPKIANPYGRNEARRQEKATPKWFIDALADRGYLFDLDVCATPDTTVCERYFGKEENGLAQTWSAQTWAWCNPPFGDVRSWLQKATFEKCKTLMLLPFTPGTRWWQDYYQYAQQIRLITPRLNFWNPGTGQLETNVTFNSCLWEIHGNEWLPILACTFQYLHLPKPKGAIR